MASILPELSRTSKTKRYFNHSVNQQPSCQHEHYHRKRKREEQSDGCDDSINNDDDDASCCFEIRPIKGRGIGMFATRWIPCGSMIIEPEDPIVSTSRVIIASSSSSIDQNNGSRQKSIFFCQYCHAPLGTLRDHVLVAANHDYSKEEEVLPCLGKNEKGVLFTAEEEKACGQCQHATWCNQECFSRGVPRHWFLCCQGGKETTNYYTSLEEFYHSSENPAIFRMAVDAVTAILKLAKNKFPTMMEGGEEQRSFDPFYFWNDYGAHPFWWHVGGDSNTTTGISNHEKRKMDCQTFSTLLKDILLQKCHEQYNNNKQQQRRLRNYLEAMIEDLCTLNNIGHLLGMLQCNVMEFEYPSPREQYRQHLEQLCEDQEDDNEEEDVRINMHQDTTIIIEEAKKWLKHNKDPDPYSTIGSGLYPLLTLANHDCDPNASIDVLQESNRASMIALRDIPKGQEICITYVPNGDLDARGTSERFRHHEPTRTWKWLNQQTDGTGNGSSEEEEEEEEDYVEDEYPLDCSNEQEKGDEDESQQQRPTADDKGDPDDEHIVSNANTAFSEEVDEGSRQEDRAKALLEYGFVCHCKRCLQERSQSLPYPTASTNC